MCCSVDEEGNALDALNPADGIYAFCIGTRPQKMKYAVCICPEKREFFLFNSKPFPARKGAEIECSPEDADFLTKECYLDAGLPVTFAQDDIDDAIKKGCVWPLSQAFRQRIKAKMTINPHLVTKYIKMVQERF